MTAHTTGVVAGQAGGVPRRPGAVIVLYVVQVVELVAGVGLALVGFGGLAVASAPQAGGLAADGQGWVLLAALVALVVAAATLPAALGMWLLCRRRRAAVPVAAVAQALPLLLIGLLVWFAPGLLSLLLLPLLVPAVGLVAAFTPGVRAWCRA